MTENEIFLLKQMLAEETDPYRADVLRKALERETEEAKIVVYINEGALMETVYTSPSLKSVDVEKIDFCTDDAEELEETEKAWEECEKAINRGELVAIY